MLVHLGHFIFQFVSRLGLTCALSDQLKIHVNLQNVISLLWHDTYTSPITLRTWASYGMHCAIVPHYSWFIQHLKQKDPKTCENQYYSALLWSKP